MTTFGRTPRPYLNADLLEAIGARYVNTAERSIRDAAAESGPFDLIFEGTGSSAVVFESMQALAKNGVLVLDQHHRRRATRLKSPRIASTWSSCSATR